MNALKQREPHTSSNQPVTAKSYWKRVAGIDLFKLDWYAKYFLHRVFGVTLPKLKDQRTYWQDRGQVYMEEILSSGYLELEIFFQHLLIDELKRLQFDSAFEAGCGFGWNIRRIKEEFPSARVGGVDFSFTQLCNSKDYLGDLDIHVARGDIVKMPFRDDAFDVGFSVGVFMNIHPSGIESAVQEMVRVCRRFVIHIEYDEDHTTRDLREKRAFKTNIISHDYKALYEKYGKRVQTFLTYKEFGERYAEHARQNNVDLDRWEGFEGPEKYVFIVVEV